MATPAADPRGVPARTSWVADGHRLVAALPWVEVTCPYAPSIDQRTGWPAEVWPPCWPRTYDGDPDRGSEIVCAVIDHWQIDPSSTHLTSSLSAWPALPVPVAYRFTDLDPDEAHLHLALTQETAAGGGS